MTFHTQEDINRAFIFCIFIGVGGGFFLFGGIAAVCWFLDRRATRRKEREARMAKKLGPAPNLVQKVKEIIFARANLGFANPNLLPDEMPLSSLLIDGVGWLHVCASLEHEFSIVPLIPVEEMEKWKTVGDVVRYINDRVKEVRP